MLRNILIALGVVVIVLVAAVLVLPSLIPSDVYRSQIEARALETLGRPVTVAGPVKVSVLPSIQARAEDVSIANADGFSADSFAHVGELRARLALLPLLARRVEIKEFVLMRPEISLEVDRAGRNNWTFASSGASSGAAPASGSGGSGGLVRRPGALPFDAALGDVRVVDGAARYVDRAAGTEHAITDLNISVHMPRLAAPLNVNGGFTLDGDPVRIEARLDSLRSFFDGEASPFSADLETTGLTLKADGRFEPDEEASFSGDVRIASDDLRALAAKAGAALPEGDVYRRFALSGRAAGDASRLAFENAELSFDRISGTGELVADLSGAKPKLTGTLAMGALDVTPYIPAGGAPSSGSGGGGGVPPWSEEPIDFGPLKAIDADLSISADSFKVADLAFGQSRLRARLENGRLQVGVEELNAYEGSGTAEVVADASGATPRFSLDADLANLQAQPFLQAAAKFSRLAGAGDGRLALTATGRSQAEIMRSLSGDGGFSFKDGALKGVNLAAAVRGLNEALQGNLNLDAFRSGAETDFTDMIGQFSVENGVAHLSDFRVSSPLVRVTGSGSLDIGEQSVDLRLDPRAVASTQGQGGAADLQGLGVPLRISGSWGAVSAGIDQQALERLVTQRAAGAITDQLGGDAGDLLRGALGLQNGASGDDSSSTSDDAAADAGSNDQAAADEDEEEEDPAERLIRGIFGGDDDD